MNLLVPLQVLIEASSASSFELSPRFANHPMRQQGGSSTAAHGGSAATSSLPDVEMELQEAMSETVIGEESLLDGEWLISASCVKCLSCGAYTCLKGQ